MLFTADHEQRRHVDRRFGLMLAAIFLIYCAVAAKLFWLQVIQHDYYAGLAAKQQLVETTVPATRGEIFARDHTNEGSSELYPLAANKIYYEVYIDPAEID